jgi:hypothetical protein
VELAEKEGTLMTNVRTLPTGDSEEITIALDEFAREGARRMIAAALRAEAGEYVERFSDERDEDRRRLVVRNGRAQQRKLTIGSGTIPIRAPRVNDKRVEKQTGERQKFSSRILPGLRRGGGRLGRAHGPLGAWGGRGPAPASHGELDCGLTSRPRAHWPGPAGFLCTQRHRQGRRRAGGGGAPAISV